MYCVFFLVNTRLPLPYLELVFLVVMTLYQVSTMVVTPYQQSIYVLVIISYSGSPQPQPVLLVGTILGGSSHTCGSFSVCKLLYWAVFREKMISRTFFLPLNAITKLKKVCHYKNMGIAVKGEVWCKGHTYKGYWNC